MKINEKLWIFTIFGDDGGEEPPEDGEEGEDPREMNEIVQEDAFAVCGGRVGRKQAVEQS